MNNNEESFKATWEAMLGVCRTAQMIPLEDIQFLLETANRADSLGAIMYPTEYRDGGADNAADQRAIASAFLQFRKVVDEVNQRGNERKIAALERMGAKVSKITFDKKKG